jgi:dimethylargininase
MPSAPVYAFNSAIVRQPSASVVHGLRADDHGDPTFNGVQAEHTAYIAALRDAGVEVTILPALEQFPDAIFVEDPALVFPEGAILLRPGAETRLHETAEVAPTLRKMFDTVLELPQPGHAEGGDVLTIRDHVMIGMSARTDRTGAEGLISSLAKLGRKGQVVETPEGVLHFKTDCSLLDEETILVTYRLAGKGMFPAHREVVVPAGEEAAANALRVNDVVFVGSDYPRTIEMLGGLGYTVVPLKTTEIGKIDAGLSCMSLRWQK